jgi:hypothetical protein
VHDVVPLRSVVGDDEVEDDGDDAGAEVCGVSAVSRRWARGRGRGTDDIPELKD